MNGYRVFLAIGLAICLIALSLQVYIFYDLYTSADKVECNGIWCEFTDVRSKGEVKVNYTAERSCFQNGEPVNCSKIGVKYEDIYE